MDNEPQSPLVQPTQDVPNGVPPAPMQPTQQTEPAPQPAPTSTNSYNPAGPVVVSNRSGMPRRSLLLAGIIALIAVVLVVGYVFGYYLPNTPSNVYGESIANSGKALDTLIDYSKNQETANYKSAAFGGIIKGTISGSSFDFSVTGNADNNANVTMQASSDIMGEKPNFALRSVHSAGNASPDIYVQVSNIKGFLDSYGMSQLDNLDGQWIAIDHTLVDSYKNMLKSAASSSAGGSTVSAGSTPSYVQLQDAITKVQTVNKQYIFTTNPNMAVLKNDSFVGKEMINGRSADHYKVGYDKTHLQAYANALAQALDSSKLNDWYKTTSNGKSVSEVWDFASLKKDIANAKADYTFDMWSDTATKLVSKLTFADPNDPASVFSLSQAYTGGSQYPFTLTMNGKDSNGQPENGSLGLTVDTVTHKVSGSFNAITTGTDAMNLNATFGVTPSTGSISVAAPTNTKPIVDVLGQLGLGSLANNPSALSNISSM